MVKQRALLAVSLFAILGCGPRAWPPDVVARWDNGEATLERVEARLGDVPEEARSGEALVRLYEESAQEICVRETLVREHSGEAATFIPPIERELIRRQVIVRSWVTGQVTPTITVSEEDIEEFYNVNPGFSFRPERRLVSHIFKRIDTVSDEQTLKETLTEVLTRVDGGEKFEDLATELSDSETRELGGMIGWIKRGEVQQAAEDVIFELEIGEISPPIRVHGGLAVFTVSQIFAERQFPLEDVQGQIAQHLSQLGINEHVTQLADEAQLPEGAVAIGEEDLREVLETGGPDDPVYRDKDLELTVGAWRGRLVAGTADQQRAQYAEFLQLQRLYGLILNGDYLADADRKAAIEQRATDAIESRLTALIAIDRMKEIAAGDGSALASWFDDNRGRYQTPVELHLSHVTAAPSSDPAETARRLRAIGAAYDGNDLEADVQTVAESSFARNWVNLSALDAYHPKVKASLLSLDPPACAPVFHLNNALHLFCIEDRRQPQQMSFEEARSRVISDYIAANEQEIYTQIKEEILDRVGFEFNETRVREILHAPAEAKE